METILVKLNTKAKEAEKKIGGRKSENKCIFV